MSKIKRSCFVIMPFGATDNHSEHYWNEHFLEFLKPLIEQTGVFEVSRSEPLSGNILRTTITNIISADLVIADITASNPNVFWELGVRQSFKSGTIIIAEMGTKIPFELNAKGILIYSPNDPVRNGEFARVFLKAISNIFATAETSDSLVLDTISGRGNLSEILKKKNIRKESRKQKRNSEAKKEDLRRIETLIDEARRIFD